MPSKCQILIVNRYYPPDSAATAASFQEMAQALTNAGHKVTVICGRPSYEVVANARWSPLRQTHDALVHVEQIGSTVGNRSSLAARLTGYGTFLLGALLRLLSKRKADAIVVGSDPPLAVAIALLAARRSPVIYSLQDLHPEAAIIAGMIKVGSLTKAWAAVHESSMRRCSAVVCLGTRMAEKVEMAGVLPERIHLIPTGAPVQNATRSNDGLVQELRGGAEFVVLHAGNLSVTGAWDALISAKTELGSSIDWLCVGSGMYEEKLSRAGFRITPFRPQNEISSVYAAADLALVTQRSGTEGLVVPSKLYSLLAYGCAILAVVPADSEVAGIIAKYECGLIANPDNPSDIAAKVRWAANNPSSLAVMGHRAQQAAKDFDRADLMNEFVQLVTSCAESSRK